MKNGVGPKVPKVPKAPKDTGKKNRIFRGLVTAEARMAKTEHTKLLPVALIRDP